MSNIKFVENLVSAFIEKDDNKIILELKKELKNAEKKNNNLVVKRIKNLISEFPSKKYLYSQGGRNLEQVSSHNQLVHKIESEILLDEVIINCDVKNTIISFLNEWEGVDKLLQYNLFPTNRLLFYGPPGTGKTKLAHAIANKLDFPLIIVRLDEVISSFLGKTGKNIREIFQIAENENVVIFLDEIDTVAKHRDDDKELGELKRVVTVLLQNIDMFPYNSILIGATNHEHLLDRALWRRFPVKLKLDLPDSNSRKLIFKLYLNKFQKNLDLNLLSELTKGYSGSTIRDISEIIKKQIIINGDNVNHFDIIGYIIRYSHNNNANIKLPKKSMYKVCQKLKDYGYSLKDISNITNIPYTTLRDNVL